MSVNILIPSALRPFTDRQSELAVEGATVGAALAALVAQYPDLRRQIYEDDGKLRGFVNVFVEGTDVKTLNGLDTPLAEGANVMLIPAIAGGR